VAAVIGPWNFPLAIPCGMTVAALVTATPRAQARRADAGRGEGVVRRAVGRGRARDVLQLLPGPGETVGRRSSRPAGGADRVHRSMSVACRSSARRGRRRTAGVRQAVVCEMGGKNAIIVDSSADLDERSGLRAQSASRCGAEVLGVQPGDRAGRRARLVPSPARGGDARPGGGGPGDPATDVGPLIDDERRRRSRGTSRSVAREAPLALAVDVPNEAALRARVASRSSGRTSSAASARSTAWRPTRSSAPC
jgi:RHH-type proline utilization regulon transcriptional repressor/proline dehydrogenase/delta 1-pyrroline-5-carboxylate dehydrogenase